MEATTGSPPRFAARAEDWFEVVPWEPGVTLIAEPGHVFSWLIAGTERSILLDTGMAVADVREAIEPHVRGPVSVINSHMHFDHVGGNHLFADVAAHELAPGRIDSGCAPAFVEPYARIAPDFHESYRRLEEADRDGWFLIGPGQRVREWPERELSELGWEFNPPRAIAPLAEGSTIDLGDRELRVIHTPGHAIEHICLLDERSGILFAQDQAYYGPQLIYLDGSDIAQYARSARRLADDLIGSIRTVYAAHCLRPEVPPQLLTELADASERVVAGSTELRPVTEMFGDEVLEADFGHFSIQVPADYAG